jgi:Cu(I)/Ag(I) efflux system periplasmic protein CusF
VTTLALLAALASPAIAQQKVEDAKRLAIKHGEIKNLDMPPMTMVFQVKDVALLDTVKPG